MDWVVSTPPYDVVEINRSEARMHDHMDTNTNTVLSHLRLVIAIMVPVSLGVLGLLAKVIFDSG